MSLKLKNILIGVTGSISCYKSISLIRLLKKKEARVKVILTPSTKDFINPLTFSTVSDDKAYIDFASKDYVWNNHIELANWADLFLIAPATATTIAKIANGIADNLLVATYMSSKCPVFVAPAMDLDMSNHPSNIKNIKFLQKCGANIIDSTEGELMSGLYGKGRMEEPENIIAIVEKFLDSKNLLSSKEILITAGPTREFIDPVRFISNASSGMMGISLASEFANYGAKVNLVLGPTNLDPPIKNTTTYRVTTADEMYLRSKNIFPQSDIIIFCAAVSDYYPNYTKHKIKKDSNQISLKLQKNIDIANTLSQRKKSKQITIGFALETRNFIANAKKKLIDKNLDYIILNSLDEENKAFESDTNKITIISTTNTVSFPSKKKSKIAEDIVDYIIKNNIHH